MREPISYPLDPARTALVLVWIAMALLAAHVLASYAWAKDGPQYVSEYGYVEMFDLDAEEGFGTWYAAVTLLLAGRILLVVARDSRNGADGLGGWWLGLAIGFHILSVDEVAGMHEWVNGYGDDLLGLTERWTFYAAFLLAAVAAAYVPFLVRLYRGGHRTTLWLLGLAGGLYVGGAVLVERVSPESKEALQTIAYNVGWISLEEGLEMAGVILLIYTLLRHLRGGTDRVLSAEIGSHDRPPPAGD